ncbi:hypothetical protein [Chondromyces crocatus]|uniref:Uncharacterized protein n=1 Tax=Chondromyces crocatus TaxID=52 RepID=A0A0K1ETD6_CHOCO|nr:hypothetical protein [Chondromyces crocatus]AKT43917.1 uncharacterized protein CMC5_081540 [Chondromyces crocatus]
MKGAILDIDKRFRYRVRMQRTGKGLLAAALVAGLTVSGGALAQKPPTAPAQPAPPAQVATPAQTPPPTSAQEPAAATTREEGTAAGAAVAAEASAQQTAATVDADIAVSGSPSASSSSSGDSAEPGPSWKTIAVGSGITAAFLGGSMIFLTLGKPGTAAAGGAPPVATSEQSTFRTLGLVSFAGAWVAGALTVAYAIWPRDSQVERDRKREDDRAIWVAPSVGPGTAGLVMQGHF